MMWPFGPLLKTISMLCAFEKPPLFKFSEVRAGMVLSGHALTA